MKKTYIIIALIVGGSILAHGALTFISTQNKINIEKERIDADTIIRTKDYYKQGDLEKCLSEAKDEFDRTFELNSTAGKTPGGQEARKWNNNEISL